jgi:methanogenic corrinoid protein MtbC1
VSWPTLPRSDLQRAARDDLVSLLDEMRELIRRADLDVVPELLEHARADAATIDEFVDGVLVPLQHAVGDAWEAGEIAPATEHAVTEMVVTAMHRAADAAPRPRGRHGRVLVGCFPNVWHPLAADMVATVLRAHGLDVVRLPSALTQRELIEIAADGGALALALSASISVHLRTIGEVIAGLHAVGARVMVGGAAFGDTGRRAESLGADAWSATATSAVRTLLEWERHPPAPGAHLALVEYEPHDDDARARIIDTAVRLTTRRADGGASATPRAGVRIASLLDFAESALVADDPTVLSDFVAWWERRLRAVGASSRSLDTTIEALAMSASPGPLRSIVLAEQARRAATPPPSEHPEGAFTFMGR